VLFFAGIPETVQVEGLAPEAPVQSLVKTPVDGYRTGSPALRGLRYSAYGYVDNPGATASGFGAQSLSPAEQTYYLQTPKLDPRIPELARSLTANARSELDKAAAIERHLKARFGYSLELLKQPAGDPLAHFLFDRKKGHCEYFASAMAILLRSIGVPSRMATGFQSGTYNPLTGWYLIRSTDAHAWVEAYVPDRGWAVFDPTPPDPAFSGTTLVSRLRMYADALDVAWQDWVMSYDLERQIFLVDRVGRSTRSFSLDWIDRWDTIRSFWSGAGRSWLLPALGIAVGLAALGALASWLGPALLLWWRRRQRVEKIRNGHGNASDATLLYEQMLLQLGKRGFHKPAWMTPGEFVEALPQSAGSPKQQVAEFTTVYQQLRFGNHPSAASQLVRMLEELQSGRPARRNR
jgi:transglutaminase-like putative cysteine protease